jgi:hypothetical protein
MGMPLREPARSPQGKPFDRKSIGRGVSVVDAVACSNVRDGKQQLRVILA